MFADDPGKAVAKLEGIVILIEAGDGGSDDVIVEIDIFDSLVLGTSGNDARLTFRIHKSLTGKGGANPADRITEDVCVAKIRKVKLIDSSHAKGFRLTESQELSSSVRLSVETGNVCTALLSGIRIIERIIVEHVIGGELTKAPADSVNSTGCFVVAESLIVSGRRERAIGIIGRRDELQEIRSGSRPRRFWDHCIGE